MRSLLPRSRVLVFGAIAIGAGLLLGLAGWPQPHRTSEFGGLILAAILASSLPMPKSATDWGTMPLSFVVDFTSLLLLGPNATLLVAAAGTGTRGLSEAQRPQQYFRMLMTAAIVMASTQAAGFAHQALGGTMGHFSWPWQGVPIGAALVAYCLVKSALAEVVVPLCARQPVNRSWVNSLLQSGPSYFIGASLAVGLVEVVDRQVWEVLPVAIVPLFFAYRAYCAQLNQQEEEQRRREVIDALDQGMSVLDGNGVVTLWNDTLERILECPRNRALNHTVAAAVPALGKTELPKAIAEVLASRNARTLSQVGMASASGLRVLQVRILPVPGGVTLLWHDVTERARAEQALKRSEERLALAAEGANDGLWEWDLRTQEFYFSGRWREMLGLPPTAGIGRANEWIERVHSEDAAGLKAALEGPFAGTADHFQHEHRIRHEDGTYRRFLCRGVAVRGAGRRSIRIAGSLTDTTEQAIAQERLRNAGFLDPLTGLCNRAVFVEGLGRRLTEFKERRGGSRFAVLYLDLDRFKVVNDSLGHLVGDELLTAVARRLESCLRQGDVLARLGGDEFVILLNALGDEAQANAVAFRIQKSLSSPFSIGGREVFTSASIGIAFGRAQYNNPEEIMRDADVAMYHAKSGGKARHEVFDADMHARALDRLGLESDLRHAVNQNDFEVHYQPIVLLDSGMCVGFESLIRWTRNGQVDLAGDVHSDRRGARADRIGRHVGPPAGVFDVRRMAAAFPGRQPRLHHRQRVQSAAGAAELPRHRRGRGADRWTETVRSPSRNHGDGLDGQSQHRRGAAPGAARLRREDLPGRLRDRLLVAQSPAQAPGRCAQDRSVVRQEPAAAGSSRDRREYSGAGADDEHERGCRRHRERSAVARARAARLHARAGLSVLEAGVDASDRSVARRQPAARAEADRTCCGRRRHRRGPGALVDAVRMAGAHPGAAGGRRRAHASTPRVSGETLRA